MPDLTRLMSEWPGDFEKTLKAAEIPTAFLNCSLKDYVDIICGMCFSSTVKPIQDLSYPHFSGQQKAVKFFEINITDLGSSRDIIFRF